MKIIIVGGYGQLGTRLYQYLVSKGHLVGIFGSKYFQNLNSLEINNNKDVLLNEYLDHQKPDIIFNLAALTNIIKCQERPDLAYASNVKVALEVIDWAKCNKVRLLHISTDHLYNGDGPHKEQNPSPINNYAITKLFAEYVIKSDYTTIIRTNYLGKSYCKGKESLTDWIFKNFSNQSKFNLFTDIYFSPIHVTTLCQILSETLEDLKPGTYNLGTRDSISKADFAFLFAESLGLNTSNAIRTLSSDESSQVMRPKDMQLDITKFESTFNIKMPSVMSTVQLCSKEYLPLI